MDDQDSAPLTSVTIIWLTGLSGAGKSTIARALRDSFRREGTRCAIVDGDDLRRGLNSDLGFTDVDRIESVRRAAELANILAEQGITPIVALISPHERARTNARSLSAAAGNGFIEVHVDAQLEVCRSRDPKGLYGLASKGSLPNFTGISSAYDIPKNPDVRVDTTILDVASCVAAIIDAHRSVQRAPDTFNVCNANDANRSELLRVIGAKRTPRDIEMAQTDPDVSL
jgi:adenylyl-sulfate kinase